MGTTESTSGGPGTAGPGTATTMTSNTASGTATTDGTTSPVTTDTADTGTDTTGPAGCDGNEVCVPDIPTDWSGPIVLSTDPNCPAAYPTSAGQINDTLVPGVPQCNCGCNVGNVSCQLFLENSGQEFNPSGACESPPFEDECLSAIVDVSCQESFLNVPATPLWANERLACEGAAQGNTCDEGTCFPDASVPVCISQDGDHTCPAPFDDRMLYFRDFTDTRDCSPCDCSPGGQRCEIDIEICSVGFDQVTLESDGACEQLNSSDGDGVSLLSSVILDQGECTPDPGSGEISGEVTEIDPVTVCCL